MAVSYASVAPHPSIQGFIRVDGTRLHYFERGAGRPVVLLHGNGGTIGDFVSSGITDSIAINHRVIVFDRPGFGHSERPRGRKWGPLEQAKLLLRAFALLNIERPIVVGHSWGTLVALALALEAPKSIAGLVLLSGYYYPMPQSHLRYPMRNPIMEEYFLHAIMPFVGYAIALSALQAMFAPCTVPEQFKRHYSIWLALRPSQMKAVAEEAEMLSYSADVLSRHYKDLQLPINIIAGADDRIVETERHSAQLHRELGKSNFCNVPGKGHMIHHAAPHEVISAIAGVGGVRRIQGTTKSATRGNRWGHASPLARAGAA